MRWVILASILAVEATTVVLLLQMLARWIWVWIRWPAWLGLIAVASLATVAVCESWGGNSTTTSGDWSSDQDLFNFQAPFPTYRLLWFGSLAGIPILLAGLGLASLLGTKNGGLRLLRWSASWKSSLLAFASACGFLVVVVAINDLWLCRRIRALDNESRSLAIRVAPPSCPDDQNAAATYLEVAAFAKQFSFRHLSDPTDDVEALRNEAWSEYFVRHADVAERIRAASTRPRCLFHIDWFEPNPIAEQPELDSVRSCTRLLAWQGRRAFLDGDIRLGFENAVALRRIAEQLSEDPRDSAQRLAYATESAAADLIEHMLYLHRPTSDEVSRFVRPGFEFRRTLPAACTRQEAEYYRMLAMTYFGTVVDPDDAKRPGFRFLHAAVLARNRLLCAGDDLRVVPQVFAEMERRSVVPYGEPLPGANQAMWFYAYRRGGATITEGMDPVYSLLWTSARADMRRRLVDFALGVAEQGLIGQMLEDGPGAVIPEANRPIDLIDGQPVRIILADGGIVIYSIDVDGDDDGGVEGYLKDMTFCLGEAYKTRRLTSRKSLEKAAQP